MPEVPILAVESLTRVYSNAGHDLTVLDSVSFQLHKGESCAIVGPSGSGKTTLLGLCAGLDLPSSGTVRINDVSIGALDEDERAILRNEHVGFVFQNFQLMPNLTAIENVLIPLELRGQSVDTRLAMDLLNRVGLGDRLDHYPTQLSGGEQQRVALARAFINQPHILFADEPTGNLDEETAHRVVDLIFEMNNEQDTVLVLVTHDLELAQRTQRVIRLKGGRVIGDVQPASQPA